MADRTIKVWLEMEQGQDFSLAELDVRHSRDGRRVTIRVGGPGQIKLRWEGVRAVQPGAVLLVKRIQRPAAPRASLKRKLAVPEAVRRRAARPA